MNRRNPPCVCFDRLLPDHPRDLAHVERIALFTSKMWTPGDVLTVSFLGGSNAQQQKVVALAASMEKLVNLKFNFVASGGTIRIAFNPSLGAWSYIGKDCLGIARDQPTMNLGFDQAGTYAHEWAHLLGGIHEHTSPFGNPIQWNKEQVYHDLSGPPNNWDRATIDSNMFTVYSQTQLNGTTFDPKSILLYSFPASWTVNGFHVEPNAVLSELDKQWLASKYPGVAGPVTPPTPPAPPITTVLTGFGESVSIKWRNGGVLGDIGDITGTIKRTA